MGGAGNGVVGGLWVHVMGGEAGRDLVVFFLM